MKRDQVFRDPQQQIVDFVFDETVAAAFTDMIRRSVPGYEVVVPMTGLLAARALPHCASTIIYDLGCSLGATTLAVLSACGDVPAQIIAVDNSPAMLKQAAELVVDDRVTFTQADITTLQFEPCAVVLMNWVAQFLSPAIRLEVLQRIRRQMDPQGLLIVSEKIRFSNPEEQAYCEQAHLDFKRANGYSELEISQKRAALENVMIIDSEAEHTERFHAAGFESVQKWFQCLNWASFLVRPNP
jgi:tRNA (cmo5U34)-methyltransferase